MNKQFSPAFGIGLLILLLASVPFAFTNLDLTISAWAFRQGNWTWGDDLLWKGLYRWGTLPGLFLGVWGLVVFLGSWIKPTWENLRKPAAVILIALLLGPGLLVNVLGKGYWGRPRPRDVISLGGQERFHRLTEPGLPGRGKSFPSGHPSVGYIFCVLFFLDPGPRRRWAWMGAGLAYGTLLGTARVLQGAHFASDVLWSGGLTYLSAAWAARTVPGWFRNPSGQKTAQVSRLKKALITAVGGVLIAGLALFFLLATPFYKQWEGIAPGSPPERLVLKLPPGFDQIYVDHQTNATAVTARVEMQGFGFPKLKLQGVWQINARPELWQAALHVDLQGWVTEKKSRLYIIVPIGRSVILAPWPEPDTQVWIDQKRALPELTRHP